MKKKNLQIYNNRRKSVQIPPRYDVQTEQDPLLDKLFFSKYRTIKKLGEGSFGSVYKAMYDDEYYAIKMEDISEEYDLLENEATILSYLQGPHIPKFISFSKENLLSVFVSVFVKLSVINVSLLSVIEYFIVFLCF